MHWKEKSGMRMQILHELLIKGFCCTGQNTDVQSRQRSRRTEHDTNRDDRYHLGRLIAFCISSLHVVRAGSNLPAFRNNDTGTICECLPAFRNNDTGTICECYRTNVRTLSMLTAYRLWLRFRRRSNRLALKVLKSKSTRTCATRVLAAGVDSTRA